jgi:hypothetical protein
MVKRQQKRKVVYATVRTFLVCFQENVCLGSRAGVMGFFWAFPDLKSCGKGYNFSIYFRKWLQSQQKRKMVYAMVRTLLVCFQ